MALPPDLDLPPAVPPTPRTLMPLRRPDRVVPLATERDRHLDAVRDREALDEATATEAQREIARKKRLVQAAMDFFKLVVEAEAAQRDRELVDLKFDRALPEDQWPEHILQSRAGGIGPDGRVMTERPCLVIPKLDQPVQQIINEARNARMAIQVKAKGDGANTEGAELRQGMIRAIEVDSRADVARMWALERAVKCGRGYYRILKDYANDGDRDMDLIIRRIPNQGSVYLDPFAVEPDWSDGEAAMITEDLPRSTYRRRYGDRSTLLEDDRYDENGADGLTSVTDQPPGWLDADTVRVAEYFYVEHTERWLVWDEAGVKTLLKDGELPAPGVKVSRKVDERKVK